MTTDSSALIVADGLTIRAANAALLVKNISFTLGRERVALVGESGSGKSLTARAYGPAGPLLAGRGHQA